MIGDRLSKGDRCLSADTGLRAPWLPGTVEESLPSGYMVLRDGCKRALKFSEKKVKRLGRKPTSLSECSNHPGMTGCCKRKVAPLPATIDEPTFSVGLVEQVMAPILARPKPKKPNRSEEYKEHVRRHDCCNCGAPGPCDPDHVGGHGVGQKCSDFLCIPLCRFPCHRFRTDENVLPDPELLAKGYRGYKAWRTKEATELIVLRAQVQMLREWAEKEAQRR